MSWRLFKKIFTYETIVVLTCIVIYVLCRILNITCLIYKFTKIPCPTCYMGRALCSALKGDFRKYVSYNIMAIPVFFAFILELYSAYLYKYRKIVHSYSISVLIINMIYYLVRLYLLF